VLAEAKAHDLVSDEHFTVDGTLLEAWARLKSFKAVGADEPPAADNPGNPTVNWRAIRTADEGRRPVGAMMCPQ